MLYLECQFLNRNRALITDATVIQTHDSRNICPTALSLYVPADVYLGRAWKGKTPALETPPFRGRLLLRLNSF